MALILFTLSLKCDLLMILEQPDSYECADEWSQHVYPNALSVIIMSYLVDRLSEAQGWVQTGSGTEREIITNAKDVGEGQCLQEDVASLRILILALCQG